MSHGNVSVCGWLVLLFVVTATTGCSNDGNSSQRSSSGRAEGADLGVESYGIDKRDTLRIRKDPLHNRLWVLSLEEVRVYDIAKNRKKLLRQIAMPKWSVVPFDFACMPDMALDKSGSAFIASNAQPRIWRIDADSFELKEQEIILQGKEQWDLGFGALAFAQDGTLLALSSPVGLLWSIDVGKASASIVEQNASFRDVCELTMQFVSNFEKSGKL
jgi:hypothetical protein